MTYLNLKAVLNNGHSDFRQFATDLSVYGPVFVYIHRFEALYGTIMATKTAAYALTYGASQYSVPLAVARPVRSSKDDIRWVRG